MYVMFVGYGAARQIGINTTADVYTPTAVLTNLTFSTISSGTDFVCALQSGTGSAFCWGGCAAARLPGSADWRVCLEAQGSGSVGLWVGVGMRGDQPIPSACFVVPRRRKRLQPDR